MLIGSATRARFLIAGSENRPSDSWFPSCCPGGRHRRRSLHPVQLPPPAAVPKAAVDSSNAATSDNRHRPSAPGFGIGAVLGMIFGAVLGLSRWADALLTPLLGALRAVPSLAWVPLLILWMQIGEDSNVTLIAIGAFFPVFTTLYAGLQHVDPHLVEAGRAFGYKRPRLFKTVQLPAVVPSIFSDCVWH